MNFFPSNNNNKDAGDKKSLSLGGGAISSGAFNYQNEKKLDSSFEYNMGKEGGANHGGNSFKVASSADFGAIFEPKINNYFGSGSNSQPKAGHNENAAPSRHHMSKQEY